MSIGTLSTLLLSLVLVFGAAPAAAQDGGGGDGHGAADSEGQAATSSVTTPFFNESASCGDPAGVITPASTTDDSANRSLPSGHQVRGPWGDFFGRDYSDVAAAMVEWTVPMSGGITVRVHRRALPAFERVAANLAAEASSGRNYTARIAATWVWRRIGGSYRMSTHSFGTTIDINWDTNPYRADGVLITDMPEWYVDAWREAGFCWGGDWNTTKDAMHFSWMGPAATRGYGSVPGPYRPLTAASDFGDEAFSNQGAWASPNEKAFVTFADMNRDGSPDLVRLRRYGNRSLLLEYARSSGDYRHCATSRLVARGAASDGKRLVADQDGDSRPDVWTFERTQAGIEVAVFRYATGLDVKKILRADLPSRRHARYLAGDLDRDGRIDLYVVGRTASGTRLEVWSGRSGYTKRLVDTVTRLGDTRGSRWTFDLGDLDVDGRPDLYAVEIDSSVRLHIVLDDGGYGGTVATRSTAASPDAGGEYGIGDYDGDGRSDLLSVTASGQVSVHPGGETPAGSATYWFKTPDAVCSGFGGAAAGDLDGDRMVDLAIGAPGEDLGEITDGGVVNLLYGGASGPRTTDDELWYQDSPGIEGPSEPGDRFGAALAGGDFDGDGYADLAVAAPTDDVGSIPSGGVVNVIYGSPSGLSAAGGDMIHQEIARVRGKARHGERFGAELASGDFDGDGFADLAIGIPRDKVGPRRAGSVEVIYGGRNGLRFGTSELWSQATAGIKGTPQDGDLFGGALGAGDIDGDGRDDLVIGAPGENRRGFADAGAFHVLFGGRKGLDAAGDQRIDRGSEGIEGGYAASARFGASLTAGDFDGDGRADVAAGAPGDLEGTGRVAVMRGTSHGLKTSGSRLFVQGSAGVEGTPEPGDRFGASLEAGDFDDDGFADLAIGAPKEGVGSESRAGAVSVLTGSRSGLRAESGNLWFEGSGLPGTPQAGDRFGSSLTAGDIDGDGYAELTIGIPGEDLGAPNAGSVVVVFGSVSGLTIARSQMIGQDTAGVEGTAERGDGLGSLL